MAKKTHGKTASGAPITDELVAELAEKAEAGYDVDEMLRRRGGRPRSARPPRASSPSGSTPSCARHSPSALGATTRPPRP